MDPLGANVIIPVFPYKFEWHFLITTRRLIFQQKGTFQ